MSVSSAKPGVVMPLRAAKRDAIWYRCGPNDDRTPPRFHIVAEDWQPACNQRAMILDDGDPIEPGKVPEHRRCRKPGCREHWPETT